MDVEDAMVPRAKSGQAIASTLNKLQIPALLPTRCTESAAQLHPQTITLLQSLVLQTKEEEEEECPSKKTTCPSFSPSSNDHFCDYATGFSNGAAHHKNDTGRGQAGWNVMISLQFLVYIIPSGCTCLEVRRYCEIRKW